MTFVKTKLAVTLALAIGLSGCNGDDGDVGATGPVGANGANGSNGLTSLVANTQIFSGHSECFLGGTQIASGIDLDNDGQLQTSEVTDNSFLCNPTTLSQQTFSRISSFPVCTQLDANCDTDTETSAEIIAASEDGTVLVYTDSPQDQIGFINLTDPQNPLADGVLGLSGEPTSVSVVGNYALVGVNTSADFINVSGSLAVVDMTTRSIVANIDLGGQPDSVAVSPDGSHAAIAIENERDEDLGDGAPPQLPAGSLAVVNLTGEPSTWTASQVTLTGLADLYGNDPEPEYVDINQDNIAVVTLQENNHIVLVNLETAEVVNHFSAGMVDLTQVDLTEEKARISQTENANGVLREPDGVTWLNTEYFATADEGDLDGGSRGFTIFNTQGQVVHAAGSSMEHLVASIGHYPDGRSGNKGNEPENAEYAVFGDERYLFVNSERSSLVFVYDVADFTKPVFKQMLPAAAAPEGALAIPSRNLLVVASEADDRGDKLRSVVNVYSYTANPQQYPTIQSNFRVDGTPIPFGALSGLAADPQQGSTLYAVDDSFYLGNRIFTLDTSTQPARLQSEIVIKDSNNVLASLAAQSLGDTSVDDDHSSRVAVFDQVDLANMINDDQTVNIDSEGIAVASAGGFWIASEGSGTQGDTSRPINSLNMILKTSATGDIEQVITLPSAINAEQVRFGFEGIAEYQDKLYVAFQRSWQGDNNARIGVYDLTNQTWQFLLYPLDTVESQNGGWVGLSDITALNNGQFLVLERDNQGGPDAAIKRLYRIDTTGVADGQLLTKTLVQDLIPALTSANGLVPEKVEGLAILPNGDSYIVNDNDGLDDNSGEIQLINLGNVTN